MLWWYLLWHPIVWEDIMWYIQFLCWCCSFTKLCHLSVSSLQPWLCKFSCYLSIHIYLSIYLSIYLLLYLFVYLSTTYLNTYSSIVIDRSDIWTHKKIFYICTMSLCDYLQIWVSILNFYSTFLLCAVFTKCRLEPNQFSSWRART